MASTKNSNRKKRKYGDKRKAATEQNRKKRLARAVRRQERLTARTQSLVGQHVTMRSKDHAKPLVGTVLEVVDKNHKDYPHEARRHVGRYLRVRTTIGDMLSSRHRSKRV